MDPVWILYGQSQSEVKSQKQQRVSHIGKTAGQVSHIVIPMHIRAGGKQATRSGESCEGENCEDHRNDYGMARGGVV